MEGPKQRNRDLKELWAPDRSLGSSLRYEGRFWVELGGAIVKMVGWRGAWIMMNEHGKNKEGKERDSSWRSAVWAAIRGGWIMGLGWLLVIGLIMWLLSKVGVLE